MENLGDKTNVYYMTYHRPSGQPQKAYKGVDLSADFHTYAVKWVRGLVIFCLDNVEQFFVTKDVFRKPMSLFLDLAVGGTWAKPPNSSTPFPSYLDIDYVRVYAIPGDNSNPPIQT
jgi:beta-glucanase (GH16 family)